MGNKNIDEPSHSYAKFYIQRTGERYPEGFNIHHIDENRENNSITNLVALPSELHRKYHKTKWEIEKMQAKGNIVAVKYNSKFLDQYVSQIEFYIKKRDELLVKNKIYAAAENKYI